MCDLCDQYVGLETMVNRHNMSEHIGDMKLCVICDQNVGLETRANRHNMSEHIGDMKSYNECVT